MIAIAIKNLRPNSNWAIHGESYDDIVWLDQVQAKPTEAEILAEVARLQAESDAQEYARKRATEYPSIGDQLDALFHAGAFPAEMAAKLQAVKDKYSKVKA
jgi:hypothetical protein